MKALFVAVLLLAMAVYIYRQSDEITTLQTALDTEKVKTVQLQADLASAKAALAAATRANAAAYANPLIKPPGQPAQTPTPAGNWMWKDKGSLDSKSRR